MPTHYAPHTNGDLVRVRVRDRARVRIRVRVRVSDRAWARVRRPVATVARASPASRPSRVHMSGPWRSRSLSPEGHT